MADIRERLVLEDGFSSTLTLFANQMSAAAKMAGAAYASIWKASEASATQQISAQEKTVNAQQNAAQTLAQAVTNSAAQQVAEQEKVVNSQRNAVQALTQNASNSTARNAAAFEGMANTYQSTTFVITNSVARQVEAQQSAAQVAASSAAQQAAALKQVENAQRSAAQAAASSAAQQAAAQGNIINTQQHAAQAVIFNAEQQRAALASIAAAQRSSMQQIIQTTSSGVPPLSAAMKQVVDAQQDAGRAIAQSGASMGRSSSLAHTYAQAVVEGKRQAVALSAELMTQNTILSTMIATHGASSEAVKQQTQAVRQITTAIEENTARLQANRTMLNSTAGGSIQAANAIRSVEQSAKAASSATNGLTAQIKQLASGFMLIRAGKALIQMSDSMTQTRARLDMMNDGLQSTDRLNQMIFHSAQRSRGAYAETADMVAKMGTLAEEAFTGGNKEAIGFVEQLNKHFTISGTTTFGKQAAILQITQAMSSGVLRGQELKSVMEQVPTVAKAIADSLGVSTGKMREMAAEGMITAEVVKNALFNAAEETDKKFDKIPMTWSQVFTAAKNEIVMALEPVLTMVNLLAQNMDKLAPVIAGVAGAIALYAIAVGIANIATSGFILTLMACPLMLAAAVAVGVLIALIYKWVKSVGGIKIAWATMVNMVLTAIDTLKIKFASWLDQLQDSGRKFGLFWQEVGDNVIIALMGAGASALQFLEKLVNGGIGLLNDFIGKLNKIPGVSIQVIDKVTFGAEAALENEAAKAAIRSKTAADRAAFEAESQARKDAISQMEQDAWDRERSRLMNIRYIQEEQALSSAELNYDAMGNDLSSIAGDTKKIAKSVDAFEEDLKFLTDAAERRFANNYYVTLTPTVAMQATIKEQSDVNELVLAVERRLEEEFVACAEGVYR